MKHLLLIMAIAISSLTQAQTFHDIYVGGSSATIIAKFKAKKYVVKELDEYWARLEGRFGIDDIEVFLFFSPKTKTVFKLVAYFPKQTNWEKLKESYWKYNEALTAKYGEVDKDSFEFIVPYKEGEGDEMDAVKENKIDIYSIWIRKEKNLNLMLEISEFAQLRFTYENAANVIMKNKEIQELQMKNL